MSRRSMQNLTFQYDPNRLPEAVTSGQKKLSEAIDHNRVVFVTGPAGTGKTYISMSRSIDMLRTRKIDRIILTRPVVEAGESLGFLPGTLEEKIDPYLRPLYDAVQDMVGGYQLQKWLADKVIEIAPLAYMRGRTFNNSCILFDEAQNATKKQIKLVLTRIGHNTKVIINGDTNQIDISEQKSGLRWTENLLDGVDNIQSVHLSINDIVRDDIVADIVRRYEEADEDAA